MLLLAKKKDPSGSFFIYEKFSLSKISYLHCNKNLKGVNKLKYFKNKDELLFYRTPAAFTKNSPLEVLKYAIGANLYMPGTQNDIFEKLIHNRFREIGAITLCLEDAIQESELKDAEDNVLKILNKLFLEQSAHPKIAEDLPLIFIRVRNVEQFYEFSKQLDRTHLSVLAGFCFPKFDSENGNDYFSILNRLKDKYQEVLYGMPILEDRKLMSLETRIQELSMIKEILLDYKDQILNIRVGGTDFSSVFGLRRSVNHSIYDIHPVADCLTTILNEFLPYDFVISGPVWEYFSNDPNTAEIHGLKKELRLDLENGFFGKTIIHPSQINVVNQEYIVNYHDYMDAKDVLSREGGVSKGNHRMNEAAPHHAWAKKIIARSKVFGVLDENCKIA